MKMERWVNIQGYESSYQISSLGKIRRKESGEILTMSTSRKYKVAILYKDGEKSAFRVHRLVAVHFIPNPLILGEINHINNEGSDNRVENLEWCTRSENMLHAYSTNSRVNKKGKDNTRSKQIGKYNLNGELISVHTGIRATAKDHNTTPASLHYCLKNESAVFKKMYKWKHI